jgi:hypothetical protein
MGVMSRRVLPACSSLCYLCPSLRARSRQPVKRHKKIIADIYQLPPVGQNPAFAVRVLVISDFSSVILPSCWFFYMAEFLVFGDQFFGVVGWGTK